MTEALAQAGCTVIRHSSSTEAPFRISFEAPDGERIGIVAYAFLANTEPTRNRPPDEHRFQIKYSSKVSGELHELWQDPFGLYTTLLIGVNPDTGVFVGADPVLNSPTRFFISKEFKQEHIDEVIARGWHAWERVQRGSRHHESHEVLVGGTARNFLRYVLFEREAKGEEQGHRHLLAERFGEFGAASGELVDLHDAPIVSRSRLHALEKEFELGQGEILDLIARAPRLRMAVRGWVAQRHLVEQLSVLPEVATCEQLEGEGQPDVRFQFRRGRELLIECKNVLRRASLDRRPRLDFMRTRASIADPCSRYYGPTDFDVVAACLHAKTETWTFRLRQTAEFREHAKCVGKLDHRVVIDDSWSGDMLSVLRAAANI